MISLFEQPILVAMGWALLHFVWQGLLLAAICRFGLAVLRKSSSHSRYLFSFSILMLMLGVAAWTTIALATSTSALSGTQLQLSAALPGVAHETAVAAQLGALGSGSGILDLSAFGTAIAPMLPWLVVLWLIGVLLLSVQLVAGLLVVHRSRTRDKIQPPAWVNSAVGSLSKKLGLKRAVRVFESERVLVPTVIGWLRPVILLPGCVLTGLSQDQLQAIIAHEMAHIRRHDYIFNFFQAIVEVVLFFHPAMWWVSAQVRTEREHCCDDAAVELCGDVRVYVDALAELEQLRQHSPRLAFAATGGSLLDRVKRLAGRNGGFKNQIGFQWVAVIVLISLLFVSLSYAQFSPFVGNGGSHKIFWTERDRDQIRMANQDGTNAQTLISVTGGPLGVVVDRQNNEIYWTDEMGRIQRANLERTDVVEMVVSRFYPISSIALDVQSNKLYWAERYSIWRADLDGDKVELLVDNLRAPSGLQLDLTNNYIYWTDMVAGTISRASLEHLRVERLIGNRVRPVSIALDHENGWIYWTEDQAIRRSNLDGSDVVSVFEDVGAPVGLTLDLESNLLYWTDGDDGVLRRSNLDRKNIEDLFIGLKNPIASALK